jgi:glycyl-tRNA synthetase
MAHYAKDCWDAEIETCYGWLECVGIADRACFDLNAHAVASKVDLAYREALETPIEVETLAITKACGITVMKAFKKAGKAVKEWLEKLPSEQLKGLVDEVTAKKEAKRAVELPDGPQELTFLPEHLVTEIKKEKQTTTTFMPGVVEPSFGIDRILFASLEHAYYARPKDASDDGKQTRGVLSFPACVAPYKLTILPLEQRIGKEEKYLEIMRLISGKVNSLGHTCTIDDSGATIGKRYSRNDELGIPFACTIDHDSLKDGPVTLRERDSMVQILVPPVEVGPLLHDLCWGRRTWKEVQATFPARSE